MSKAKGMVAIVDDDESVCRAMKRLVRSIAIDAETFSSGREFLDAIETMPSFRPDCVVLDVQMPGLNGLEVCRYLAEAGNRLPIIFITAHDTGDVHNQAIAMGAVAFLRKPFNDEVLIKTLDAIMRRVGET